MTMGALTADMQMESSEWWLQVNELNYHYSLSDQFYVSPDVQWIINPACGLIKRKNPLNKRVYFCL